VSTVPLPPLFWPAVAPGGPGTAGGVVSSAVGSVWVVTVVPFVEVLVCVGAGAAVVLAGAVVGVALGPASVLGELLASGLAGSLGSAATCCTVTAGGSGAGPPPVSAAAVALPPAMTATVAAIAIACLLIFISAVPLAG
jgi:hypothetical protein